MTNDRERALEEMIQRLAAAIRSTALYSPTHPTVTRCLRSLQASFDEQFRRGPSVMITFLGNDIVIGRTKLKGSQAFEWLVRHFRERQVEKLSFSKDMGKEGLRAFIGVAASRDMSSMPERLAQANVKGIGVGAIVLDEPETANLGIVAARQVYGMAVGAAESLWGTAQAGEQPDPDAARLIIDTLAKAVSQDRTSMLMLTSLKGHDAYTFTHMVNVSLLTMAQARTLGIQGPMLREFGLAGLMHDIGKVRTPHEILNKPDRLTDEEQVIMRQHVVDGAQILRHTPEMPPLAAIVAFEHHLKQDQSGYPEKIGSRTLNLCTMLVSIADVFDALRSKRVYRDALPAVRVRKMLAEQSGTAFEPTLLRRFISLVGIFPVGTSVRLKGGEIGIVTAENATDPFRPTVKIVLDESQRRLDVEKIVDTDDHDDQGRHPYSVLEAVDAESLGFDLLEVLRV